MTIMADSTALRTVLADLICALDDARAGTPGAAWHGTTWQENAAATIRRNVTSYLEGLSRPDAPLSAPGIDAVCRISGIRKGVSDLGLFVPGDRVMMLADRADTLATRWCAAARTAVRTGEEAIPAHPTDPAIAVLDPTPLDQAITLAVAAHRGQVDKGGAPYILHPLRIMLRQRDAERRIAAVLHDVVEDGGVVLDTIRTRFGNAVADAVDALTRRDGESYDAFVRRCATNAIARDVKRSDIEDNLDLSRLTIVSDRDHDRARKYRQALAVLDDAPPPPD